MPTPQEFKQLVLKKYPTGVASDGRKYSDIPDQEFVSMVVSKYPDAKTNAGINYADYLQKGGPNPVKPGTLVAPEIKQRAFTADQAKAQEQVAQKKASGFSVLGETLKGVGSTIANAEIGLGKSLAKIYGDQGASEAQSLANLSASQSMLLQRIREKQAKGEDVTRLAQTFNDNQKVSGGLQQNFEQANKMPTTGEVSGQLGGTALDVLTAGSYKPGMQTGKLATSSAVQKLAAGAGVPELGKIAGQKASGLFTGQGVKNIAKGAGIGYASDVTQGLQGARGEERTGAKAFIPGMGTAIGAAIPVISETRQSFANRKDPSITVNKRLQVLQQIEDSNAPVRKTISKASQRGIDAKKVLAETDLLHNSIDNTGTMRTQGAIQELNDFIKPQEDVISANLKKEGRKITLNQVRKELTRAVNESGVKGGARLRALRNVEDDIAGYALEADKDGYLPLSLVHDAKVDKYANINYMNPESKRVDKIIAKTLKEIVERNTKSVDVKSLNQELSQHYSVLGLLEKLDGRKVEGGRLGKHVARIFGTVVGSHFGPLGAIVGGEVANAAKGASMASKFGRKIGQNLESSPAMQRAIEQGKESVIEMPQSSQLGSRNTNQSTTMIGTSKNISSSIPQDTYFGQGKKELKEIGKKAKAFAKNPKIGLSLQDVSKEVKGAFVSGKSDYVKSLRSKLSEAMLNSQISPASKDKMMQLWELLSEDEIAASVVDRARKLI